MLQHNDSIFVLSNGSTDIYPDNTLTSFKNKFPISMEAKQKYQIAVQGICLSQHFKRVLPPPSPNQYSFIVFYKKDDSTEFSIRNGYLLPLNEEILILKTFTFDDSNSSTIVQLENVFQEINDFIKTTNKIRAGNTLRNFCLVNRQINLLTITNRMISKPMYVCLHPHTVKSFNIPKPSIIKALPAVINSYEDVKLNIIKNNFLNFYLPDPSNRRQEKLSYSPIVCKFKYENCDYFCFKVTADPATDIRGIRNMEENLFSPEFIRINCPQIEEQIFDNTYTRDLLCFTPELKNNKTHFYQEFKNKQYVTLENTILDSLEIKIVDENNSPLQLLPDIATFLHLKIRTMPYYDDEILNIHVSSKPRDECETNKPSHFKVKLPQELHVDQSYKMALTSINYPCNFATYPNDQYCLYLCSYKYNNNSYKMNTPRGLKLDRNTHYSMELLIAGLDNFLFFSAIGGVRQDKKSQSVKFEIYFGHKDFIQNDEVILFISKPLLQILGYEKRENFADDHIFNESAKIKLRPCKSCDVIQTEENSLFLNYNSSNYIPFQMTKTLGSNTIPSQSMCVNTDGSQIHIDFLGRQNLRYLHPKYLMIYLNVLNPSLVGGEFLKILKVVPVVYTESMFHIEEMENKDYISLQNYILNMLEFEIRSHDGAPIRYPDSSNVLLNLELTNQR